MKNLINFVVHFIEKTIMRNFIILAVFALAFTVKGYSQGIPVGAWRHHLPSKKIIATIEVDNKIIGASEYGLVIYDKEDNSISKYNKVNGLSDFELSFINYFKSHDIIFIGYLNGNIDLLKDGVVYNIPDIKQTTSIFGSKKINNAIANAENIFVATDFGIVQISLDEFIILNTLYIGENASLLQVNDIIIHENNIIAATESGVLLADLDSPNLADFNSWESLANEPVEEGYYKGLCVAFDNLVLWTRSGDMDQIFYLEDDVWQLLSPEEENYFEHKNGLGFSENHFWVANKEHLDLFNQDFELSERIEEYLSSTPQPNHAFFGSDGDLWISDSKRGIVRKTANGQLQNYVPEGPLTAASTGLGTAPGIVWVTPGSITEGGVNTFNYDGVFYFENESWKAANRYNIPELDGVFDVIRATPDPGNSKQVYLSSWTEGLIRLTTSGDATKYNEDNSTLQRRVGLNDRVRIGGAAFDSSRNLWVTNSEVEKPISVRKNNGDWLAFSTNGLVSSSQITGKIVVDDWDQKWIILPGNGILLFKENSLENSNDYQVRKLSTQQGNGALPSNYVYSIAVDLNGYVWVGTQKGVAIFYTPQDAFTENSFNAQQIIVTEGEFAGLLLENDQVNTIAIDGANNKWFGTNRSGAFFMTPDARNTYQHLNTSNSPLPSDNILDIAVEPESGEVFFATDRGLASFRNWATAGGDKHEDVYAYPNPVKPGYEGYIAIKGLVRNADIRITDISGNLVYKTIAQGGQAIWNGRDLNGRKPSSGVYVVFSTNEDGSEKAVTKILFLN
ncbi:MAG: two-component regulator propeller domain-containing protein [Bacteroidales bacterium]